MISASLVGRRDRKHVRKDVTRASSSRTRSALRLAAMLINRLAMTGYAPILISLLGGRASLVVTAAKRGVRMVVANRHIKSDKECVLIAGDPGLYRAMRVVMADYRRRVVSALIPAERMDIPDAIMGAGRVSWRSRAGFVKHPGALSSLGTQVVVREMESIVLWAILFQERGHHVVEIGGCCFAKMGFVLGVGRRFEGRGGLVRWQMMGLYNLKFQQ
jgi:hypothetical protein